MSEAKPMLPCLTEESLLNPKEVSTALNVPISWVYSSAEKGAIPSLKIGKYRRFRPSDLAAWLELQRQESSR